MWKTVRELYEDALENKEQSLILVLEFLMEDKKVLKLSDSVDKFTYFLQDRFATKMNEYLADYERRRASE